MSPLLGAWARASRLLMVRLDAMGDVLMTTPAFRALAQSSPDVDLTLLTSPAGAAVAPLLPEIHEVVVHDVPWVKGERRATAAADDLAVIERLRAGAFDGAVIFTVHTQSALPAALLCHLAGIPRRLAHVRENPYQLLTDWIPDPEHETPIRHETRRQLDLVRSIGARAADEHLSVRIAPDVVRRVRTLLAELRLGRARPWAVVAPGASAASRRYPAAGFASVARMLVRDHGWQIVVTGSAQERALGGEVARDLGPGATNLSGLLDVAELAALLAAAPVLIGNNSGPVHLAAAVGTPVVDLYALTNLQHAPWGVPSRLLAADVPCRGCRKSVCPYGDNACLVRVPPDAVVAAAVELVGDAGVRIRRPTAKPPAGILPADVDPAVEALR